MVWGVEGGASLKGITSLTLTDAHEQSARQTLATVAGNRRARFIVGTGRAPRGVAEAVLTPTKRRVEKFLQNFERGEKNFIDDMASSDRPYASAACNLENRRVECLRNDGPWRKVSANCT
jgi:hypothetical protein